jgi:hypothetical protein
MKIWWSWLGSLTWLTDSWLFNDASSDAWVKLLCLFLLLFYTSLFVFHHRIQNGSGAHSAFYPTGTRGSLPGM